MAVYCFTQAIQPGKRDEAKAIFEGILSSRRSEYEASRRLDLRREWVWFQSFPEGEMAVVYDDPSRSLQEFSASDDPFDGWPEERGREVYRFEPSDAGRRRSGLRVGGRLTGMADAARPPEECASLEEVRRGIDALDREMVALIGRRSRYVRAAAAFKKDEVQVRAPERRRAMLGERRRWAEEEGLSPNLIEDLYERLISYFIDREMKEWRDNG